MVTSSNPVIEVFADIWCPFAHVGLRTVEDQRILTGRTDVAIRVRAWPLELVNGAPLDPATTRTHVIHLREQVAPMMFTNFTVDRFPTSTLNALSLVERAYRTDLHLGERTSFFLRDALFERGQDISDQEILRDAIAQLGLEIPDEFDRAAVLAGWHEGQERGVRGSPHLFCGEADSFCPSLHITNDPEHGVAIQLDTSRLAGFLEECLARTAR